MANTAFDKLKELELSRDEVEAIGEALKKEEFRKLLVDYVEEVKNPENRKIFQKEVVELERERGYEATFVNPNPGYVIKTSIDGTKKCFINVASSDVVEAPNSTLENREGSSGHRWTLPHTLAPPRDDLDNKGIRCQVFDVVFHPQVISMALKSKQYREMVNITALDSVETNFHVTLDRKNLKFPKIEYKGYAQPAIIRKLASKLPENADGFDREMFDKICPSIEKSPKKSKKSPRKSIDDKSNYTTPKYLIKHRSHVEMDEFVEEKTAKQNAAIPKELVIEVNLPLLRSSADITLDVTEKTLQLVSERPSKYKLSLTLPYRVNQDAGNAKFDKDLKKLIVTLPVKRHLSLNEITKDDSGVESDQGSPLTPISLSPPELEPSINSMINLNSTDSFLDTQIQYLLPEFTCHLFESNLAFTLNVKNVDQSSVKKLINLNSVHLSFTSISSSFYPSNYAFYIELAAASLDRDNISVEVWDNNVVLQIPFETCDSKLLKSYFYGLSNADLHEKFIEEPSILNTVLQNPPLLPLNEIVPVKDATEKLVEEQKIKPVMVTKSEAINILGTSCESSGDELSCSSSPGKGKGILKRLSSSARYYVGRSVSESSLDDYVCCSSVEMDSAIPENGEISTSLKKTVRFNEVIKRQLYRSNSSILGQKKKNQRKAKNKKRAQERRHSESEASEIEDKKNDLDKSKSDEDETANCVSSETETEKNDNSTNDIFQMDMN